MHSRKKFIVAGLTLGTLVGLPHAASAQSYVSATLADNPLAYWRFQSYDDTSLVGGYTSDYVGDATNTAPGGGAPLLDDPNNIGLSLSGTGYVNTSLQTSFSAGGTIMCWINLSELPSTAGRIFSIAGESQVGNDFDLQIDTDNKIDFYTDSGSSTEDPTALTTNTWVNVAATLDNTNHVRSIYVDGQLVAQQTGIPTHGASVDPFYIGQSTVFGGRQFDGTIGEVAVWGSALTGNQIDAIYDTAANPVPEPVTTTLLLGGVATLVRRRRSR